MKEYKSPTKNPQLLKLELDAIRATPLDELLDSTRFRMTPQLLAYYANNPTTDFTTDSTKWLK